MDTARTIKTSGLSLALSAFGPMVAIGSPTDSSNIRRVIAIPVSLEHKVSFAIAIKDRRNTTLAGAILHPQPRQP